MEHRITSQALALMIQVKAMFQTVCYLTMESGPIRNVREIDRTSVKNEVNGRLIKLR